MEALPSADSVALASSDSALPAADVAPIAAIILAGGGSSRLGAAKQLLRDARGDSLLLRLVEQAHQARYSPIVVVLGAQADDVRALLHGAPVVCVENQRWQEGMATSIQAGIELLLAPASHASSVRAAVLMACDQPAVTASHLRLLREQWARTGARVVSRYDDVCGIPAIWPRADWPALAALHGDRGARALLTGMEDAVPLAQGALDLDTPTDVRQWHALQDHRV